MSDVKAISFRWFKDGAEITRETARRFGGEYGFRRWALTVPNASPDADSGNYRKAHSRINFRGV